MTRIATFIAVVCLFMFGSAIHAYAVGEFDAAWRSKQSSIVLDAYEFTPLNWNQIPKNTRLVGFINKGSDGLPPKYCGGAVDSLCRVKWRRYSVTKELYHTRRTLAKALGLKWGVYHLARPGNPIRQAQHLLSFAQPEDDDLIALDIEDNDPEKWMSFADAEIFARYIKAQTGRYPVLYTNHNTARAIAANRGKYRLLSQLNLWYARYRPEMASAFPMGNWKSYSIWQFSSMVNCSKRSCPMRIRGADHKIDVNVVWMPPDELRAAWPLAELTALPTPPNVKPRPEPKSLQGVASAQSQNGVTTALAYAAVPRVASTERALRAITRSNLRAQREAEIRRMWVANPPLPKFRPGTKVRFTKSVRYHDDVLNDERRLHPYNVEPDSRVELGNNKSVRSKPSFLPI